MPMLAGQVGRGLWTKKFRGVLACNEWQRAASCGRLLLLGVASLIFCTLGVWIPEPRPSSTVACFCSDLCAARGVNAAGLGIRHRGLVARHAARPGRHQRQACSGRREPEEETTSELLLPAQGAVARRHCSGLLAGLALAIAASGSTPSARAADEPKITAKVLFQFDFRSARSDIGVPLTNKAALEKRIVIGVYGEEAPVLTRSFLQAATGTYTGPGGRQAWYKLGSIKALEPNKYITFLNFPDGNMKAVVKQTTTTAGNFLVSETVYVPLAGDDTKTNEENSLRHDRIGRVSMVKGGGSFEFQISPVEEAPWLDKTNVVMGQVLEGLDVIDEINKIPAYRGKPTQKVKVKRVELVE